ncbi:MAG: hypothetical protein P4L73_08985 [Caulobacteraceae bacterium]|nr:hypothetical protein [Caulobacteraceae bacterium]
MVDKPRRPLLTLKAGPKLPEAGEPAPPAAAPAPAPVVLSEWKCKPCGKTFQVPPELGDDEPVRCPACNARLGLAKEFRVEDPALAKVRARHVVRTEPPPAAAPRPHLDEITTRRRPGGTGRPAPQVVSVVRRTRRPDV